MTTPQQRRIERARKGGLALKAKYGRDHFVRMGKLGGRPTFWEALEKARQREAEIRANKVKPGRPRKAHKNIEERSCQPSRGLPGNHQPRCLNRGVRPNTAQEMTMTGLNTVYQRPRVQTKTVCPSCGLDWTAAEEGLQDPPGSESYTLSVHALGRCHRVCGTYRTRGSL